MKDTLYTFLLLVILLYATGCTGSSTVKTYVTLDQEQLPEAKILQAKYVSLPVATNIEGMVYNKGKLLLYNLRADSIFMLLNTDHFELLRSWGRLGRGPREYGNFVKMCATPDGNFALYDKTSRRIDVIDPNAYDTTTHRFVEESCADLPQRIAMNLASKPFHMIYSCFDAQQRNIMSWAEGSEPRSVYHFPDLNELASTAKNGFLCTHFEKNRIVYAYTRLRRFDIMDTLGTMVRSVSITPNQNIEAPGTPASRDHYTYYFDAWAGPDSFFLYYVGYTGQMLDENLLRPTYIEEYDYDGNPIARYEIDQFIRNICLVKDNRVVCTTVGNERHPIVVYKL